jgi:hypothetical protein
MQEAAAAALRLEGQKKEVVLQKARDGVIWIRSEAVGERQLLLESLPNKESIPPLDFSFIPPCSLPLAPPMD